jgi:hypothetical protein
MNSSSTALSKERLPLNLMIVITAVLLMLILGDNIQTSLSASASDKANYEKRKKYFEEVIVPARLDLHPAKYYIIIDG